MRGDVLGAWDSRSARCGAPSRCSRVCSPSWVPLPSGGPGTVYLALTGAWSHAIVLAIWGTFVVSGIDNVLRPRLVAGRVGLSELAMFFALLGGLSVFGALGVVLGPVAFATAAAIVETLREPTTAVGMNTR